MAASEARRRARVTSKYIGPPPRNIRIAREAKQYYFVQIVINNIRDIVDVTQLREYAASVIAKLDTFKYEECPVLDSVGPVSLEYALTKLLHDKSVCIQYLEEQYSLDAFEEPMRRDPSYYL